jgi:YVTN family beta-propeller protein
VPDGLQSLRPWYGVTETMNIGLVASSRTKLLVVAAACLGCLPSLALGCSSSSSGSTQAAVVGPAGRIYVSMYGDDEITVFDQATLVAIAHIPVGKGPAVLLATADNKKLYSANWSDNTISAIDLGDGDAASTVKSIALDGRPWAIALSPVGHTLFAGVNSNKLVAIDTATDAIVSSFDTSPNFPESVIVSKDGQVVYIDPTSTNNLSLAALGSGTFEGLSAADGGVVQAPLTVGGTPAWASISPDGTRAYTLNFVPGTVSVVDTAAWQIVTTVSLGAQSWPIISSSTADGLLVVTNFGAANLVTIDFHTNSILHTLALDGRPVGVGGYNVAGTLGYVVDFGHPSLSVKPSITNAVSFLSGDLSAYVGSGPGHLTMFNPSTGEKIGKSIEVGKGPTSLVVIPQ